jgi:glycine dehydrogenase subunit 1
MPFIPHTEHDIAEMLEVIGAKHINDLFDEIPQQLRAGELTQVPDAISEMEMAQLMQERASQDSVKLNFLGAGAYEHHIPAAVWDVATRGEYMTAYTPYQAEASQGTLQVLYEYQTNMANLTGMDVSNASLYDGASGLAEAVLMAVRANRKCKTRQVLLPANLHPHYEAALRAIVETQNIELVVAEYGDQTGTLNVSALPQGQYAAVVIAQPNFFGQLEAVDELTDWTHEQGALAIALVNPMALALLTPPGNWGEKGADIACGDGQPLGVPMASGGPYYGFICCKQAIVRQMPGRIIGRTVDLDGNIGYALTLQAREQHIRRSKATSNICTNQGLAVTASTIYMALMGSEGLSRVAQNSHLGMKLLSEKLATLGIKPVFDGPYFHERVFALPVAADKVVSALAEQGVVAGLDLGKYDSARSNQLLICVTETKSDAHLDHFIAQLQSVIGQ